MANDILQNPWTLDTTGVATLINSQVYIRHIEFIDYSDQAHTCIVKNAKGKVIWTGNGAADFSPVRSGTVGAVNGLYLDTLGSGKVRVYIK